LIHKARGMLEDGTPVDIEIYEPRPRRKRRQKPPQNPE
jgi:hypothetical protein